MSDGASQPVQQDDHLMVVPTELRNVVPAFRSTFTAVANHVERLRPFATTEPLPVRRCHGNERGIPHRLTVKIRRTTYARRASSTNLEKPVAIMRLADGPALRSSECLVDPCLRVLAELNTDCFVTLLALIHAAREGDGLVSDDIAQVAKLRGWESNELDNRSRDSALTRRERLRKHMNLLAQVEFVITDLTNDRGQYVAFPLLQYVACDGEQHPERRTRTWYWFHPLLWNDMTARQRGVVFDEALLTADPQRDEWSLRLAWYLSARWAPSWVSKSLYQNGGRLTERLGVLLAGGCIQYEPQLRKQGRKWLRQRFEQAMKKLMAWSPRELIGGYVVAKDATSPLEDRVTFWPTDVVANRLTAARAKSIASKKTRTQHPRRSRSSKRATDRNAARKNGKK